MDRAEELLTIDTVGPYLSGRGFTVRADVRPVELGGGVSNVVLSVETDCGPVVVKQALDRLRVRDEWLAPRDRIDSEAWALGRAGIALPASTPPLLHTDPERHVLVLQQSPPGWTDWKTSLLAGRVDEWTFASAGTHLSGWHAVAPTTDMPAPMTGVDAFRALRLDPYFEAAARAVPAVGEDLRRTIRRLESSRDRLIHGDFSPKNILLGPRELWVIDYEVACLGDPTFDLAFLLSHLTLKAIHVPTTRSAIWVGTDVFLAAYRSSGHDAAEDSQWLVQLIGALLVARVAGKSPAEYLTGGERDRVLRLGSQALRGTVATLPALRALEDELP